ncbi:MAG: PilZ domain-containing protein [Candidatus Eremiobacteraeota bacterium]|nr:PilZ domain-containing protein [Candidatus Eremiobacteraeota bacterium]
MAASPLECPATATAPGVAAHVIVEHVTVSTCRLRSVSRIEQGTTLQFDFGVPEQSVTLRGRIVNRASIGPRFIYNLALERMTVDRADALASAVAAWYRHQELARLHDKHPVHHDHPAHQEPALSRAHRRVPMQFPVSIRLQSEDPLEGRASDISTGGLNITCTAAMVNGMSIDVRFKPPAEALEYAPGEEPIEPFHEIAAGAKVVWHRVVGAGFYSYGIAFVDLTDAARHEIGRFVEAMHNYKKQQQRQR